MPQKLTDETHPNLKRRLGKYICMNEDEVELLEELAALTDRSASAVMRVALREHAIRLGLIKSDRSGDGHAER